MRLTNANGQTNTLWSDLHIFLPITLLISLSCLPTTWALSDKRLCADEKCEKIISMGTTKLHYNPVEEGMLSFKINTPVRILSKSAGTHPDLWGVEINGRRGYAKMEFIREDKIYVKKPEYEVLVGTLPQSAVPSPTAINNPRTQTKQEPTADSVQPAEQQQSVLNSSELVDDLSTTTTSPLETLKLSILTEQDQTSSSEASTSIAPAQANLQIVDGTELPLEVVPATTERIPNITNEQIAPKQSQTAEVEELDTTTNSDDNFDYEDSFDEENDEATVHGKINDISNDKEATEATNVENSKANIAIKMDGDQVAEPISHKSVEEVLSVPKLFNTETSTQAGSHSEVQTDSSHKGKQPEIVGTTATNNEIFTEAVTEAASKETQSDNVLPASVQKPQQEINQPLPIELENKNQPNQAKTEEYKDAIKDDTQKTTDTEQIPKETVAQIPIEQPKADQSVPVDVTTQKVDEINEAETIQNQTNNLQAATEIDKKIPIVQPKADQQSMEQLVDPQSRAQEDPVKLQAQSISNEIQNSAELDKNNVTLADKEAPKPKEINETQLNEEKPENVYNKSPEIKTEQVHEGNETQQEETKHVQQQVEVSSIESQTIDQEEPPSVPVDVTTQKADEINAAEIIQNQTNNLEAATEIDKTVPDAPAPVEIDAQLTQSAEIVTNAEFGAHSVTENIETAQVPYKIDEIDSSTIAPTDEPVNTASLPPLFKNQHFNDPTEYYKQLQEQEQRQKSTNEAVGEQPNRDSPEQLYNSDPVVDQNTTPNAATFDAYDAVYDAEPTPAPPARDTSEQVISTGTAEPLGLPSLSAESVKEDAGLGAGLFSTIMGTVNSFIPSQSAKKSQNEPFIDSDELHHLLYPDAVVSKDNQAEGHCSRPMDGDCHAAINLDNFVDVLLVKVLDNSLVLLCVIIAATSSLLFIFIYYCFCNSSQESALLAKLNHLERSLLASHKENLIVKNELMTTRTKLSSIEDNSFGSNDMVVALKNQLETEIYEKTKLQDQVNTLEKDLDNAAEAGLELNKMLSEVLSSQNGDEAFMSTVEELQRQLNDQERIIIEINATLAEKSRENSELQYTYTESTARMTSEMKSLKQDNYELEMEKAKLQTRIEEVQAETEQELAKALEARNYEMQRLQHQIMELNSKYEKAQSELQTSLSKIDALEDCLKALKKDSTGNVQDLIASAKTHGELNATKKKLSALQAKLEQEVSAKIRLENQLKVSSDDVEQLKHNYNQSESDKLEAQTRLEVLSGYFREKETQLQKELSLQEAKWLQHQGENASTVETQTLMKNEIHTLKSQNDELRAEIEAQIASHKAQMGTLENRAHESWLAARQSERRCEEAQAEAAGLRRKLTAMASGTGGPLSDVALDALPANGGGALAAELNPSPLPLPLPGSPGLLNMPNPLPFLSTPFSPFMGLPPFLPPAAVVGVARPPPLGRMRSPPPTSSSRGGDRYSPHRDDHDDRDDYSDYDDYDDDDEDERGMERRRRLSGSWGRSHHDSYMHSPRTYRSLSPSDSRYNYNDTETDFSPPHSPPPPRKGGSRPINEV